MTGEIQYIRKCDLIVSNDTGDALNLAGLSINFAIKKTDGQTPNTAAIRVYNLNDDTLKRIKKEFTSVTLQAGYESNYGVIFDGNVKQFTEGRENVVDHYLDIQAADGDESYNFAVVNATLSAGAKQRDQIEAAAKTMQQLGGTGTGYISEDTEGEALPRGKVMYGMARDYIRQSSQTAGCSWTIQNGKIQVVPLTGILPGQAVVLNSKSGLIGAPEQTNDGIKFRCLINPQLVIGGKVQINEKDILRAKLDDQPVKPKQDGSLPEKKQPAQIQHDGFYRLITATIAGNTRGNDWYIDGVGLSIDQTAPPGKKVQAD